MKTMHVYSHTHWDHEWYFTASESLIQLVYHMDEVLLALEQGILKTYLLDSQVSILEEYLQYMPENKERIERLVHQRKLLIGPWYTQSDELVISGESLVRNLSYGIAYANTLGHCMKIGYLPDSFGQSQDMPKIYQGFGIQDAIFWRGVPKHVTSQREFYWHGVDGSQVLCYHIKDGYFYGGNIIYNDAVSEVEERLLEGSTTKDQLVPLGGDQRYVDFNIAKRLDYYNTHTTHNFTYVEDNLEDFFKQLHQVPDLPHIQGEFIDASVSKIHHSIYSSRYDHKQLNDAIERRIIYQLEPFMVMQMEMGITPKTSVLRQLWKKLLLNHAHDSACGCNSDATNESILQRLKDCDQMSTMLLDYQVRKLSESIVNIKENDVVVYNTLPYTRDVIIPMTIATQQKYFSVWDDKKQEVPFTLHKIHRNYRGSIKKDLNQQDEALYYFQSDITARIVMPPLSMQILHIEEGRQQVTTQLVVQSIIENDFYCIQLVDKKLQLYKKDTKTTINDFLYMEDAGDEGDTYDYSWPTKDWVYSLHFENATIEVIPGDIVSTYQLKGSWLVPIKLDKRADNICETKVDYTLSIQLDHTDVIRCQLTIDNTAIEHRMRVICRGIEADSHSYSDTPFGTIQRDHDPVHKTDWKEVGYHEEPSPIYPMLHHVSNGQKQVLTCFSKGIKEYEILDHTNIALTLFRSVPYLGKPDLNRRPGKASGNEFRYIPTPGSTLLQSMDFHFALSYRNAYDPVAIHKSWQNYAIDYVYYQLQELDQFVSTQKYFVTHPYPEAIVPITKPIVSMDQTKYALFSSLYPLDERHASLRIYNGVRKDVDNDCMNVKQELIQTNMLYEPLKNGHKQDGKVWMEKMQPEEIRTYKVTMK